MPIVALEGPDRCGKSSMLAQLAGRVYGTVICPGLKYMEDLLAPDIAPKVEARQAELWSQLYMPGRAYLLDRSFTCTPEVYSLLKNRPLLVDPEPWRKCQLIVYMEVPLEELQRRHKEAPDKFNPEGYRSLLECYEHVLPRYKVLRITPQWSTQKLAQAITKHFALCRLHGKD